MGSACSVCSSTGKKFETEDGEEFNAHMREHTPAPPPKVKTADETRDSASADTAATVSALQGEVIDLRRELGEVIAEGAKRADVGAVSESLLALADRVAALETLAALIQSQAKPIDTAGG